MTNITINGKIITVLEKKFEDKKTVYAQFLMESESKGMEIIKVKITNEADIQKLEKEVKVNDSSKTETTFIQRIKKLFK